MELRQLEYFLAIADCGNMAEASKKLHVSSPALSTALKELERELGFSLFDRNGRRLTINENGRYFSKQAQSVFTILSDAQHTIQTSIIERQQTVNVRVELPLGRIGKHLFRGFHRAHKDMRLRMGYANSSLLVDKGHASVDLEILGSMAKPPENERTVLIGFEDFVAVLPADHPLASKESLTLEDLKDEPLLMGEPGLMRTVVEAMFAEVGIEPRVVAEMQLYTEALQLVRAGIGSCIAGKYTWFEPEEPELAIRPLENTTQGRYIYAQIPENREPSEAAWKMLSFIRKNAKDIMK